MKSRPRRIERDVAKYISLFSSQFGMSPVERIPVIGRTGPDIGVNELGLIIDVKSRLSIPKSYALEVDKVGIAGNLLACRLSQIELILDQEPIVRLSFSKMIQDWWAHMDEWRRENHKNGITALVLHRPGTHVRNSILLINQTDRRKLYERSNHI